jgi:Xaa-Pro aminopeptidase
VIVAIALWAQITRSEYAARRDALAALVPGGVLVAIGAPEPPEDYIAFQQTSSFEYLTGINEPNAALVIVKHGPSIVFVEAKDPAQEVWVGARMGPAGATRRTGLPARERDDLTSVLDSLVRDSTTLSIVADTSNLHALTRAYPKARVIDASQLVEQLRGTKSDAELGLIARAAEITSDGERAALDVVAPGVNEYRVQARVEFTFRDEGADRPSFASIVGSGPNATTLHYHADSRVMQAGELVVMDVGASYRGYAGDVTRTVPVNGKYSAPQRAIYQLVRDAQAAAERQATIGAAARLMNDSATAVLAAGLARLGLIESADATYECGPATDSAPARLCAQYSLYYMHGLGHGIGLDVHDPEQFYFTGHIGAGSAFTIEPGVYVRAKLPSIVPDSPRNRAMLAAIGPAIARYANVGVRIEDDYIATASGVRRVSNAPRELNDIETLMRRPCPSGCRRGSSSP